MADVQGITQGLGQLTLEGPRPSLNVLPPELRLIIWELVLGKPRMHRVELDLLSNRVLPTITLLTTTAASRAALATCRESRSIAKHILPNEIPFISGGVLHYDAKEDVICLEGVTLRNTIAARELKERKKWAALTQTVSPSSEEGRWMSEVRNIGIEVGTQDARDLGFWFDETGASTLDLVKLMSGFSALRDFFVISRSTAEFDVLDVTERDADSESDYDEDNDDYDDDDNSSIGFGPEEEFNNKWGFFVGMHENNDVYAWGIVVYDWTRGLMTTGEMDHLLDHLENVGRWRGGIERHFERPENEEQEWRLDQVRVRWLVHFCDQS